MPRDRVATSEYHVPVTSFTQAVRVPAGSALLFISGITARTADGTLVGKDDIEAQSDQIFRNIDNILKAAGATLDDIVKTTAYVMNPDDFNRFRSVREKYIGFEPPASTIVTVSRLYDPDMLVEVEAVATIPAQ
jgi:2-iminobutanoate/2-iminopropanoate deaminase